MKNKNPLLTRPYYTVHLEEIAPGPISKATLAMRQCMCCGTPLTATGGPGDFLCDPCVERMRSGEMQRAMYFLESHPVTSHLFSWKGEIRPDPLPKETERKMPWEPKEVSFFPET